MKEQDLTNWGNYPRIRARIYNPDTTNQIQKIINSETSILARGNGKCYGDSALNENIISMLRYNRFLEFDQKAGILECQAGVLLADILDIIVPEGFFLMVTPGTKLITVGGAIASDIHGKNHHVDGNFSNCVLSLTLMNDKGERVKCSRDENTELFWNTVGGMGLSGVIIDARLKLKPVSTAYIRQEQIKANNLGEIMSLFEDSKSWTYSVAWIDCLKKGKKQGRSILMRGEHALPEEIPSRYKKNPLILKKKKKLNIPFMFPSFVLNPLTVMAFNFLYFSKQRKNIIDSIVSYDTFFYPLDAIDNWNRIYGRNGFTQYQFVIPKETSHEALKKILDKISERRLGSFLVVLKLFGKNEPLAKWAFPIEGYTLALDFKIQKGLKELFEELNEIVLKHQGHLYLSKDSMSCKKMFHVPDFKVDKFVSHQYKRLTS